MWCKKDSRGRAIPAGLRLRQQKDGRQWYTRAVDADGKQRDKPTGIFEGDADAIRRAKHILSSRRVAARETRATQASISQEYAGTLKAVLETELARFASRDGRDANCVKKFEAQISNLFSFFGADTAAQTLIPSDIERYIAHRRTQIKRRQPPSYGTIFRELAILKAALKRAQGNGLLPIAWSLGFPARGNYPKDAVDQRHKA